MAVCRGAWIEVDLNCIFHNVEQIRLLAREDAGREVACMPILKGGAYGHGIYALAQMLHEHGYTNFGVALYSEASIVKLAAPGADVLILGYTPARTIDRVIREEIIQTIYDPDQARLFSQRAQALGKTLRVHIKLDTGMHRLGFPCTPDAADQIQAVSRLPGLAVTGLFTHFATAAMREKSYVYHQFAQFQYFQKLLRQRAVHIPCLHISNTGVILDTPQFHQDMIRFGSMVYGTFSSREIHRERVHLKRAFSLKAEVAMVKTLEAGMGIGYDLSFVTERRSTIATLPIGYADISIRHLKNNGYVLVHGQRAPIVGGICMDQMMIDVTGINYVEIGTVVTLIGEDGEQEISLDEISLWEGTDPYYIAISANMRLPIRYLKSGAVVQETDFNLILADHYRGENSI